MAMSTSTMLIRNVHGTYPPHVAIRRSYIVCTYPNAIGGGHSARHMSESACATSTLISDMFLVHDNPGIFHEQRSLGQIFRGKILWTYILDIYHLSIAGRENFFDKSLEQWGLGHMSRTILSLDIVNEKSFIWDRWPTYLMLVNNLDDIY